MTKALFIIVLAITFNYLFAGANMVILNGHVYTVDPHKQFSEAVAIEGNTIKAVGSNKDINKYITPSTTIINAQNRLVLPGFNDAHLHFLGGGASLGELDLSGCTSTEDVQVRLAKAVSLSAPNAWITGRGWDHTLFNGGEWPTREILDIASPNNPVFVRRVDGHIGWANSIALKMANISTHSTAPEGGEILHDLTSGEPTGILKESAMTIISSIIPKTTKAEQMQAAELALKEAARLGITSIQDNSDSTAFEIYNILKKQGKLSVRVSEWLDLEMASNSKLLERTIKNVQKHTIPDFIEIGLLKGFADGTLGSRTASLFEAYNDDQTTSGLPQYSESELQYLVQIADSMALQVGVHCIGDKANWIALNAYKPNDHSTKARDARHRIEHAQVFRVQDIEKLAEYNVIASMQPTHCTSDLRWAEKRIGHERSKGAYAWRRILDAGGKIAFGTDWPVEPLDPMRGLYSAITRKNIESGKPTGGWFPDQQITIEEAIYCYTMGSAYAEFKEQNKGSITPGKLADIIILSDNILKADPQNILKTQVDMTIFDGKIIYQRKEK
jgi:predicted amidohydrolase YtcJ